jgi:hypothetical protein
VSKLTGDFKARIWDGSKKEKGVKASINFSVEKPHCDRCTNLNKRVVIAFTKTGSYSERSVSLCLDCIANLIQEVNKALDEFKLVRLVLTGQPISEALEEITSSKEEQSELQISLTRLVDNLYSATGEYDIRREQKGQKLTEAFEDFKVEEVEQNEEEDQEGQEDQY